MLKDVQILKRITVTISLEASRKIYFQKSRKHSLHETPLYLMALQPDHIQLSTVHKYVLKFNLDTGVVKAYRKCHIIRLLFISAIVQTSLWLSSYLTFFVCSLIYLIC